MRDILAGVITVFWSFNHGLASLIPYPEGKLVILSNIYASHLPCMAYRTEDNQNFITSKQCRDRVLQLTDVRFVQAITHTENKLVVAKGNIKAPDAVRFSDIIESTPADLLNAKAWYPEFRHDNTVVFHSVAVRLATEPQSGYRILAPPAGLVSGSPVFLGMELVCVFSGESGSGSSSFTLEKSYCEAGACKFKGCENGCYGSGDKFYCNKDSTVTRVLKLILVCAGVPTFAIVLTVGAYKRIKQRLASDE